MFLHVFQQFCIILRKKIFSELRKNEKSSIPNSTKIGNYTNCIISPDAYIYFGNKIDNDPIFKARILELKGKTLGCFCKPNSCHGDIIAEYLNNL